MVGGVGEYLSLVTGFRALLIVIAICYIGAVAAEREQAKRLERESQFSRQLISRRQPSPQSA